MIENAELVMQMLEMYQMYKQQVPGELEEYLRYVAKTGNTLFQWTLVKPFIREKILNVITEFAEHSPLADIPQYPNVDPFNYEAMKTTLLDRFDSFHGPPFTIQRLCELLSNPRKEYNRVDKFMRAVEKNILVVSTCEPRQKREEAIVNGVPDRWENGKESDITMDMVDKSSVIPDANVLNGGETVESLLNELESMKTPETKLEELNTDPSTQASDHIAQVTDEVKSNITSETKTDIVSTADTLQTQLSDQINLDVAHGSMGDTIQEPTSEVSEVAPVEIKEQISENVIEKLKDVSNEANLDSIEPTINEESVTESNDLIPSEQTSEPLSTDTDRVEGSIIHQTPDSDNKVELVTAALQPDIIVEKLDESIESMDVQVDNVTKTSEPEVSCDIIQEECIELTQIENDKQINDESTIDIPAVVDPIPTEMDVEPEKIEVENNDNIQPETISVSEEITTVASDTILEKLQEQSETKLTESE